MQSDFGRAVGLDFGWDAVLASIGLRFWLGAVGDSVVSILAAVLAAALAVVLVLGLSVTMLATLFDGSVTDVDVGGDSDVDVGGGVGLWRLCWS